MSKHANQRNRKPVQPRSKPEAVSTPKQPKKWKPIIATPMESRPEKKLGRPLGPLTPTAFQREMKALEELYNDGDVDLLSGEDYDRIKASLIARLRGAE